MNTDATTLYRLVADALLLVHVLFVVFVLAGLLLIVIGGFRGWSWTRRRGFRYAHLAAILVVVLQAWLGQTCPLTVWEMTLREKAGDATYAGAFIAHWLGHLLYYRLPEWVFTLAYTLFGGLVLIAWIALPRRAPGTGRHRGH